jgi:hypothetical protein
MGKIKSSLLSGLGFIITVYFYIVLFVFIPFFNWQYANQNGLMKWLFLGEISATAKALVFPYYLLNPSSENSKILDVNSQQFYLALEISQKATKLINEGGAGIVRQEEMDSIINYEKQALEIGKEVNIDELDKKYPELGSNFNNNFLKGIALYVDGMKTGNASKAIEGQSLKSEWDSWYIKRMNQIKKTLMINK